MGIYGGQRICNFYYSELIQKHCHPHSFFFRRYFLTISIPVSSDIFWFYYCDELLIFQIKSCLLTIQVSKTIYLQIYIYLSSNCSRAAIVFFTIPILMLLLFLLRRCAERSAYVIKEQRVLLKLRQVFFTLRKVEFPRPLRHLSSLIKSLAAAMIAPNHQQLIVLNNAMLTKF